MWNGAAGKEAHLGEERVVAAGHRAKIFSCLVVLRDGRYFRGESVARSNGCWEVVLDLDEERQAVAELDVPVR